MRLDVGSIGAKERFDPCDGQSFGDVHVLATTVVALAGVAFCVFVGQLCALCCHHGRRGVVFAGN